MPHSSNRHELTGRFFRPELDILRFFAFFWVFLLHAGTLSVEDLARRHVPFVIAKVLSGFVRAGSHGVDLFFVLSAYLITELLLREKEEFGFLDVKWFYIRRILRIWPLYYLFVPLAALVPFLNPDGAFSMRYVSGFLLLAGNWSAIIFGPTGSVAEPLWSVSVEEQFYLAWAPLVANLSRKNIVVACGVMIAIANGSRFVALWLRAAPWTVFASTLSHLDAMAGGVLIAVFLRGRLPDLRWAPRFAFIAIGIAGVVASEQLIDKAPGVSYPSMLAGYPLIALSCSLIVLGVLGMNLRCRSLVYLGKISYGLYVFHSACLLVIYRLWQSHAGLPGTGLRKASALALTIAIAAVSYRFWESPFLQLKRKFTHVDSRPV